MGLHTIAAEFQLAVRRAHTARRAMSSSEQATYVLVCNYFSQSRIAYCPERSIDLYANSNFDIAFGVRECVCAESDFGSQLFEIDSRAIYVE